VLVVPMELEVLTFSCGQLSVLPDLPEFDPELLPPCAVELAVGDADRANACVTPTPPIANPLASAAATAAFRIVLVISITSLPLSLISTSSGAEDQVGAAWEPTQKGRPFGPPLR